jgi:hypothetical protein
MHAESVAGLAPCRNCGAVPVAQTPPPRYCARCGQEATLHPPTLGEFLHEFVGHYVALEGPLWRSLALLFARPGRLTSEYLAGRRRRYVLPLRLYLSASFLFFVVLKLIPSAVDEVTVTQAGRTPHTASLAASAVAPRPASGVWERGSATRAEVMAASIDSPGCDAPRAAACTPFERWIDGVLAHARQDPSAFLDHLRARALAVAPYAIFLLLPVFAGVVMLAYRGRRRTYGEHFVFSLHLHAFWFFALLAMALLPKDGSDLVVLAVPVYGVIAMRRVYEGGWLATIARATLVSLLYGCALVAATAGLLGALLSTA